MKKKQILIILSATFLFFLLVGFLIPYTGDDWNNLIGHNGNFSIMIETAISNYNTFEGRFFSRIFDFIFNYYKPLWIVINAFGMTFLCYFMMKLSIKNSKKFLCILVLLCLLCVDRETFSQIYAWITGNTTYFIPFLFLILIIYLNKNIFNDSYDEVKTNKLLLILLPILSFIFSMFVENVTVGIITAYILILVYNYIKSKKINYTILLSLFTSIIALFFMLYSPGTRNRINDMGFSSLSLISKIFISFPRQMNYIFIKNSFLIILLLFFLNYIIIKNYKGIKKIGLILFFNIIPIVTILANFYYVLFDRYINHLLIFMDCNNILILIYWLIFLIMTIYFVIKFNKNDNSKILFFFLIALINNAAMLISPLAGGRTTFLTTIMLYICVIILIDNLNVKLFDKEIFVLFSKLICVIVMILFIKHYVYCYNLNQKREDYINKQLMVGKEEIEVIILPEFYLWNSNAWNDWHLFTFKKYYNIPENKQIKLVYLSDIND